MAEPVTSDTPEPAVTVQAVGLARGNPGLAGAGIVVIDAHGETRERVAKYLGSASTLEAQMQALIIGLRFARALAPSPLRIVLGNDTVVRQLNGDFPARHPSVLRMLGEIDELLTPFSQPVFVLGSPDELAEAERLANLGIDTRLRPLPAYDRPIPKSDVSP